MAKLPYMQFYPADYLRDTRCLSLAARGAWVDILCALWHAPKRGQKTLTLEGWAGEIGKDVGEVSLMLKSIEHHKLAKFSREILENVEHITITSKRIARDKMKQMLALKRKQKQRATSMSRTSHALVTPVSHQCHAEESEIRNQNQKSESYLKTSDSEEEKKERKRIKSCDEVKPVAIAKSADTWFAYANAYRVTYGVEPPRNQKTNALLCQLVDRLGSTEAPAVAAFYLSHNSPLYVRARHPPNLLVMDAEGLRTQWLTGHKVTSSEIKQAELKDDSAGQVQRVRAMLQGGL